jgi:hypothetical protein
MEKSTQAPPQRSVSSPPAYAACIGGQGIEP